MSNPMIYASVAPEVAEAIKRLGEEETLTTGDVIREALAAYIPAEFYPVVETNIDEEEDSMKLNHLVELRFHKNDSGSVSVFAMDPVTGEKLGSLIRFQNDGTIRRIKGANRVPSISTNPRRNNRIALNERPLLRNVNR